MDPTTAVHRHNYAIKPNKSEESSQKDKSHNNAIVIIQGLQIYYVRKRSQQGLITKLI